jgi:hypothetical protein
MSDLERELPDARTPERRRFTVGQMLLAVIVTAALSPLLIWGANAALSYLILGRPDIVSAQVTASTEGLMRGVQNGSLDQAGVERLGGGAAPPRKADYATLLSRLRSELRDGTSWQVVSVGQDSSNTDEWWATVVFKPSGGSGGPSSFEVVHWLNLYGSPELLGSTVASVTP